MPQALEINLPDGGRGVVVYPDGKLLRVAIFHPDRHQVTIHYHPPDEKPDVAESSPSDPNLFVVVAAVVPDLKRSAR